MKKIFECVKNKVGQISVDVFMSDDAPAYINTWTIVMGKPKHHLLCSWHIDKNWRVNIKSKIKDPMKQSEVYKACRTLMECFDPEIFQSSLDAFLLMCEGDAETKEFGIYFEKHYARRPEKWAFCFRIGLFLNTNMYLEAMHKKFKYCYMQGKNNRRVDKCIGLLMRFSRDMMVERLIRMMKNKPTHRMQQIASSHHRSKELKDEMVTEVDDKTWVVNSGTAGRGPYTVSVCIKTSV